MTDIHKLLEICLSECFFLYSNEIWKLDNLGEIGLSVMVVLSESFLRRIEERFIAIALTLDIAQKIKDTSMIATLDFKTKLDTLNS